MNITKLDINIQRQITLFEGMYPSYLDEQIVLFEKLHDYIVRKKTIKGIEIEIPTSDFTSTHIEFFNKGKKYKDCGGIYFLYGEDGGILNIGSTDNLYVRIYQKLMGKNGGSRADFYFCDYYKRVSFFCENNHHKRKVYEPYLINKLQPPLNNQYNYYDKSLYKELLKKEEAASSLFFGYKSSYA